MAWVVSAKRSKEMLLTGNDRLAAVEALTMGLVNPSSRGRNS
jgi:hypothetical protein